MILSFLPSLCLDPFLPATFVSDTGCWLAARAFWLPRVIQCLVTLTLSHLDDRRVPSRSRSGSRLTGPAVPRPPDLREKSFLLFLCYFACKPTVPNQDRQLSSVSWDCPCNLRYLDRICQRLFPLEKGDQVSRAPSFHFPWSLWPAPCPAGRRPPTTRVLISPPVGGLTRTTPDRGPFFHSPSTTPFPLRLFRASNRPPSNRRDSSPSLRHRKGLVPRKVSSPLDVCPCCLGVERFTTSPLSRVLSYLLPASLPTMRIEASALLWRPLALLCARLEVYCSPP